MEMISLGLYGYEVTARMREKATAGEPPARGAFRRWLEYRQQVERPCSANGQEMYRCYRCGCTIVGVSVYWQGTRTWVVVDTGTTADGLTYCPPNPDHAGRVGEHRPVR